MPSLFGHNFASIPVHYPAVLPDGLKTGLEHLSGLPMDDVRVHRHSPHPGNVGAFAYTHGADIHLAAGQEQHLAHEAWHAVQQKQGHASVDDDPADEIAPRLSRGEFPAAAPLHAPPPFHGGVLQRKKIPTNFGEFETTKFAEADGRGVEIILRFNPDDTKVDAKKIALSQSLRKTTASGVAYAIDPNQVLKMVGSGKSGEGYGIDVLSGTTNPLYRERNTQHESRRLPRHLRHAVRLRYRHRHRSRHNRMRWSCCRGWLHRDL